METVAYSIALLIFVGIAYWRGRKFIFSYLDNRVAQLTAEIDDAKRLLQENNKYLAELTAQRLLIEEKMALLLEDTTAKAEAMQSNHEQALEVTLRLKQEAMTKRIENMFKRASLELRNEIIDVAGTALQQILINNQQLALQDTEKRVENFSSQQQSTN